MDFPAWTYRWAKVTFCLCFIFYCVRVGDLSFVLTPAFISSCFFWVWLTVCLGVALGLLGNTWSGLRAYRRKLGPGEAMAARFRAEVKAVLIRQMLIVAVLAASFPFVHSWVAGGLSSLAEPLAREFRPAGVGRPQSILGWWGPGIAGATSLLGVAILMTGTLQRARFAFRLYGGAGFLRATSRIAFLRTFGPPKDFFEHVPLVRSIGVFALATFVWADAPSRAAGAIAAACLLGSTFAFSLGAIIPPTWLFLSASDFRSFQVFRILRVGWAPRNGITLLNRSGRSHLAAYTAERNALQQSGAPGAMLGGLYRTPERPRVWSIRVRDDAWEKVLFVLLQTVPLIVVDVRNESRQVVRELRTILHYGWLEKTVLIGEIAGESDQVHEIVRQEGGDAIAARMVTEDQVVEAQWLRHCLVLPNFAVHIRA